MARLSPWSKRSAAIGSILLVMAMFVACGDDDSDFAVRPSGGSSLSSSSVEPSSSVTLVTPCKTDTEDNCEYGELVDDRDGLTYKTVKIGDQWWMAENLNYEASPSYCYNDDTTNCTKQGRFYSWWTAIKVCPSGWHLPDTTEWEKLFTVVGDSSTVGLKLKSASGWNSSGNGTDDFGFSALSAGYRYSNGDYYAEGDNATFWSSTMRNYYSCYVALYSERSDAILFSESQSIAYSVRCVKDDP